MGAQRGVVVERLEIVQDIFRSQPASHVIRQHRYPRGEEGRATPKVRQNEIDVRIFSFSTGDHEGCGGFESLVRDFYDWYSEEIVWIWPFGTGLSPVEEDRGSTCVQFFPDWVEYGVS